MTKLNMRKGANDMSIIIIPVMTMAVGFLMGIIVTDSVGENRKITDLERRIKRMERRMANESNS